MIEVQSFHSKDTGAFSVKTTVVREEEDFVPDTVTIARTDANWPNSGSVYESWTINRKDPVTYEIAAPEDLQDMEREAEPQEIVVLYDHLETLAAL